MQRVLIVDDEPNVLFGLRRMLRAELREWEIEYVDSGHAALKKFTAQPYSVIVSDVRMSGMDGATLLREVQHRWPQTVRLVLSGQSELESIYRVIGPAHQYLSKPCSGQSLSQTILSCYRHRAQLGSAPLAEEVARLETLPSDPASLLALKHEIDSVETSIQRAGEIIASDVAMTAKILQLVGSSFFGEPRQSVSALGAAKILGIDLLRSLIYETEIFRPLRDRRALQYLRRWTRRSQNIARSAMQLAECSQCDPSQRNHSYSAAILRDIGRIVLLERYCDQYTQLLQQCGRDSAPDPELEVAQFGASQVDIGGYLLTLWGLPISVREAVMHCRAPQSSLPDGMTPAKVLYAASLLETQQSSLISQDQPNLGSTADVPARSSPDGIENLHRPNCQELLAGANG